MLTRTQGLLPQGVSRFDVVSAYYLIASHYHSSQWSKGYRVLSRCVWMGFTPGLSFGERKTKQQRENYGPDEREYAAGLLWKRRHDIKRNW